MIEYLLVGLIVLGAAAFSGWRLLPRAPHTWHRRASRAGGGREAAKQPAAGPHAGCAGCPAGADCGKRR